MAESGAFVAPSNFVKLAAELGGFLTVFNPPVWFRIIMRVFALWLQSLWCVVAVLSWTMVSLKHSRWLAGFGLSSTSNSAGCFWARVLAGPRGVRLGCGVGGLRVWVCCRRQ